jgi:3-deoxy-manno-octulosonate cytidylyltransferase (CMP-KDO synthetase)
MRTGITCVVPARLGSTRFFGKLLTPLFGKPVIVHTLERAAEAECFERVVCLTDSAEIGEAAAAHGFEWVLSGDAANGTDRIGRSLELPGLRDTNLIVNLQGDEPAFPIEGLRLLCDALAREPHAVHLLVHADEPTAEDIANPNRVKTLVDADGLVTGFFRTAPTPAEAWGKGDQLVAHTVATARLQLGAYAYHRDYLLKYAALPSSVAEREMSHEMLRAPGLAPLRAHPSRPGASVDVPEDLANAQRALEILRSETNRTRPTQMIPNGSAPELVEGPTPQNFSSQELQNRLQGAPA